MKLIVGLGNPGSEYEFSPHNLGFQVVARLAERHAVRLTRKQAQSLCGRFLLGEEEVWLIQPQTFMNRSGVAVGQWLQKQGCGPEALVVVADELDLPWGTLRIRPKGGAAGHHGLESIIEAIGTQQFVRVRIGVCPERKPEDPLAYLLSPLSRAKRREAEEVIDGAADAVETIVRQGVATAMNRCNRRRSISEPTGRGRPARST